MTLVWRVSACALLGLVSLTLNTTISAAGHATSSKSTLQLPTNNMQLQTQNGIARIELQTGEGTPEHAIIWLHGLGATADDFVPVVPHLGLAADRPIRFVFPQAPDRPITINGGMRMPGWYDIKGVSIQDKQDVDGMVESASLLAHLIDEQVARGVASRNILLFGFSQGGAVVYHQGLRHPQPLGGLACLSTYLPFAEMLANEASEANRSTPILVHHGSMDAVVPMTMGQASVAALKQLGYAVHWQQYPMAHEVSMEQIRALGAWVNSVYAESP